MCLIVVIIELILCMFKNVFCCFVNEVFGMFFVVVDEWIVNDIFWDVLLCNWLYVLWMVWFRLGWNGVLIIYWWILVLILVSVFILFIFNVFKILWIFEFKLDCFRNLLNVLVVVVKLFGIWILVLVRFEIILFSEVFLLLICGIFCILSFWY